MFLEPWKSWNMRFSIRTNKYYAIILFKFCLTFLLSSRISPILEKKYTKYLTKILAWNNFSNKYRSSRPEVCNFIKKDCGTGVFLWILRNFKELVFLENTSGGCLCKYKLNISIKLKLKGGRTSKEVCTGIWKEVETMNVRGLFFFRIILRTCH